MERFYEKKSLLNKLSISYYPELDLRYSHSSTRLVKLCNEEEIKHSTCTDVSDLADKKNFIALKVEIGKLNINKFANIPTRLNNLQTKVDDLDP